MTGSGKQAYPAPEWSPWETILVLGLSMLLGSLPYWFTASARGIGAELISYVLQSGCFYLLPLCLVTVLRRQPQSALGLVKPAGRAFLWVGAGWGLLLYAVNIALSCVQSLLFPQAAQTQEYIVALLDQANAFETGWLLLILLLLAPVGEELLFRAFFFPALIRRYGRLPGYIICAAVFAATHFSWWTLLPVFCASLGFCRLYEKYRCVWYNIIAHITWNAVALCFYYFVPLNM